MLVTPQGVAPSLARVSCYVPLCLALVQFFREDRTFLFGHLSGVIGVLRRTHGRLGVFPWCHYELKKAINRPGRGSNQTNKIASLKQLMVSTVQEMGQTYSFGPSPKCYCRISPSRRPLFRRKSWAAAVTHSKLRGGGSYNPPAY